MANFSVNVASIAKSFPKGMPVPPLLEAVGRWIGTQPRGSLGYFEMMTGGRYDDGSLSKEANRKVRDATGIFLLFGEGSELALWKHDDGPPAVVLMDSEGQNRTVAPTLEAFLVAWSKRKTGTELDGVDDDEPSRHRELAAWLARKKVKPTPNKAPDFGTWVASLAEVEAPPKAGGLPAPPKDMVPRALAAIGKGVKDPGPAKLLAELGIDLKKYKTADAQRFLLVPQHGYSLSFEKGKLQSFELTNQRYTSWDYVNHANATFEAFPHEVRKGVRTTDKLPVALKKLGKPATATPESGSYYWDLPGNVRLLVSAVDPDDTDAKLAKDAIQYIYFGAKKK